MDLQELLAPHVPDREFRPVTWRDGTSAGRTAFPVSATTEIAVEPGSDEDRALWRLWAEGTTHAGPGWDAAVVNMTEWVWPRPTRHEYEVVIRVPGGRP